MLGMSLPGCTTQWFLLLLLFSPSAWEVQLPGRGRCLGSEAQRQKSSPRSSIFQRTSDLPDPVLLTLHPVTLLGAVGNSGLPSPKTWKGRGTGQSRRASSSSGLATLRSGSIGQLGHPGCCDVQPVSLSPFLCVPLIVCSPSASVGFCVTGSLCLCLLITSSLCVFLDAHPPLFIAVHLCLMRLHVS